MDSNVLLAAIGKKSRYRPIWDNFLSGEYTFIVSEDIIYEYEEVIQRYAAKGVAEIMVNIFIESPYVLYQQIFYSWNAIKQDPDDNKFFDIAVAGNADYLVTDDMHFKGIDKLPFPKVNVINSDQFLKICMK